MLNDVANNQDFVKLTGRLGKGRQRGGRLNSIELDNEFWKFYFVGYANHQKYK